jgi:hypothetical protein
MSGFARIRNARVCEVHVDVACVHCAAVRSKIDRAGIDNSKVGGSRITLAEVGDAHVSRACIRAGVFGRRHFTGTRAAASCTDERRDHGNGLSGAKGATTRARLEVRV